MYSKEIEVNPHYRNLNLKQTDSNNHIKKRYKKLVKIWHPDKWENESENKKKIASSRFKEIQESYDIIRKEKGL